MNVMLYRAYESWSTAYEMLYVRSSNFKIATIN